MMLTTYVELPIITREDVMEKLALRWDIDVAAPVDEPETEPGHDEPSHFGLRVLELRAKNDPAPLFPINN